MQHLFLIKIQRLNLDCPSVAFISRIHLHLLLRSDSRMMKVFAHMFDCLSSAFFISYAESDPSGTLAGILPMQWAVPQAQYEQISISLITYYFPLFNLSYPLYLELLRNNTQAD